MPHRFPFIAMVAPHHVNLAQRARRTTRTSLSEERRELPPRFRRQRLAMRKHETGNHAGTHAGTAGSAASGCRAAGPRQNGFRVIGGLGPCC